MLVCVVVLNLCIVSKVYVVFGYVLFIEEVGWFNCDLVVFVWLVFV